MTYHGTLTADGKVLMPPWYSRPALHLLRGLPGGQWHQQQRYWSCSLAEEDRPRLLELAQQLQLEVAPELLKPTKLQLEADARIRALVDRSGMEPYSFQRSGIVWLSARTRALLGDDMGLGKTMQTLWSLPDGCRALVVCPASLKLTWRDETQLWRPELTVDVLKGRDSFRAPRPGELVVTNFEILPAYPKKARKEKRLSKRKLETWMRRYSLEDCILIVDEASYVKGGKTARAQAIRALGQTAARVWFLTGTPLQNTPIDLWGVLRAGGMDRELGGWGGFCRGFGGRRNRWGGWEFGKASPEIAQKLRRCMLRRNKEEVLRDLPPVRTRWIACDSLSEQLQLKLDRAWGFFDRKAQGGVLNVRHLAEGDLPDFSEFSKTRAELAASRIPDMLQLVEQYEQHQEPLVLFSAHRAPILALEGREGWAVIHGDVNPTARAEAVAAFQAGQLQGIAVTIRAGGYGLTLTHGSHVLFVDLSWVPADNRQALDRVRRIGQDADSIMLSIMTSDHPLDVHVRKLLSQKKAVIEGAIEARGEVMR